MKRITIWGLLVLLGLAGFWIGGPFYTLHQLRTAVETQDAAYLDNQVDFPLLRDNIKLQLNARAAQATPPRWRDSPLGGLALGLTNQLVDRLVESLVTPSGLLSLLEERTLQPESPSADPEADGPLSEVEREIRFREARFRFEGLNRLRVEATTEQGEPIRVVLSRQHLKWRLTNLILPEWPASLLDSAQGGGDV
ncbi:MAG: DUF2939 domain-containing protein [Pseudomonadota bacterium]|nr:DUF2939 domain-containing protein [Pseudomonadota bacterium]